MIGTASPAASSAAWRADVAPDRTDFCLVGQLAASLLGKDPAYVMGQLGHTDAAFTLRVYAHAMRRDAGDLARLKALVNGADWAATGRNRPETPSNIPSPRDSRTAESPAYAV